MERNIYVAKDKFTNKTLFLFESDSDSVAIRSNAPVISRLIPLGDAELLQIATYDDVSFEVRSCTPRSVPWDSYKFPENPLKSGTPAFDATHKVENK